VHSIGYVDLCHLLRFEWRYRLTIGGSDNVFYDYRYVTYLLYPLILGVSHKKLA